MVKVEAGGEESAMMKAPAGEIGVWSRMGKKLGVVVEKDGEDAQAVQIGGQGFEMGHAVASRIRSDGEGLRV